MEDQPFIIEEASTKHLLLAEQICQAMRESAAVRGTGIGDRSPEDIRQKMQKHQALIAVDSQGSWAGFCFWELYEEGKFVSNSGLIVAPQFRGKKLAELLKTRLFGYCRLLFPNARIFGITTGTAVMKVNTKLGFQPVAFDELTHDPTFWKGCQVCKNYDILTRTQGHYCLCTGMIFDPDKRKIS